MAARGAAPICTKSLPSAERVLRATALAGVTAWLFAAAFVPRSLAGMSDAHMLIVRGSVLAANGSPVGGAVVSSRGGYAVSATTDDRGRYTLSIPLGSALGLRRGAFALEVRAEHGGHRVPLSAGAPALGIDVSLLPGGTTVRVKSNLQDATTALATAFAQDGASTAWVEADFGGSTKGGGSMELRVMDDVDASGRHAAGGMPVIPTPIAAAPRVPAPPATAPATHAAAAPVSAPAETLRSAAPPASELASPNVNLEARTKQHHGRKPKSTRASRAAARAARAAAQPPAAPVAVPHAPPVDTSPVAVPGPSPNGRALPPSRVKPIEAFAPAPPAPFDSCACRLEGTVEIDWERPLERNFPIGLTFTGAATQESEVEMFMGSPREFRLGPLPCGDYRLIVRPRGRYRYSIARGDSVMRVHCAGVTQVHLVLVPR